MNTKTFKRAGVRFDHCRFAVVPEIPYVQDVLYAMHMSVEQKNFDFCRDNHATYIVNVGLVVAAVSYEVLCMEPRYVEATARKIIAQAILDLTAPEDKCLFNNALTEAAAVVIGQPAPSKTTDRETLLVCGCADCRETVRKRSYAASECYA